MCDAYLYCDCGYLDRPDDDTRRETARDNHAINQWETAHDLGEA